MSDNESNPLLFGTGLPHFEGILVEHIDPAVDQVIREANETIAQLEVLAETPGWDNFAGVLESVDEAIDRVWSPITHLNAVMDSPELRREYEKNLARITVFYSALGQNEALFRHYELLAAEGKGGPLNAVRMKIIENALRDFRLAGVALPGKAKERARKIQQQLSELQNRFDQNLLDATQAWHLDISDEAELSGLPLSGIEMARSMAKDAGIEGWRFGLQIPSYLPFITHSDSADLRETMYRAYSTRASAAEVDATSGGKFDNGPLITEILALKHEFAQLLGFRHHGDVSLETKMAHSPGQVLEFLIDLAGHARPIALQELEALSTFAKDEYGAERIDAWDIPYYSENLRQARYGFSDEEVRPFFPAERALGGLFKIATRIFGIRIEVAQGVESWHPDVRAFRVLDQESGEMLGMFLADLFVRPNKRGGAWMDTCIHKRRLETGIQTPAAYLVCNFTPPIDEKPALLTHGEVETLFHEFGHTLHHLLTEIEEMGVSGINGVAWDAVELPSQFMENWCWQRESLDIIGGHYETGARLPDELLAKMRAARNFQSGLQTLRQIEFALFDMMVHTSNRPPTESGAQAILDEIRSRIAVITPPAYNRFQNSFSHIFAGGYAAGYYSYKWAEVLSADAYSRFEEEGIFNPDTGLAFRNQVLARGGSEDAGKLFRDFRGRDPQIDALLRHNGLDTPQPAAL
jgi:oligopeptidase A